MQTVVATTRHSTFRPESLPTKSAVGTVPRARRLLDAPVHTDAEQSLGAIAADRAIRIQATRSLIEIEFAAHRGLYQHKLCCAGVAPHELNDALGELFELAIRWAGSYDAGKSDISSWLGNQVVRTVASSVYGTRRPAWRRQLESELSSDIEGDDCLTDTLLAVADEGQSTDERVAVAAFLERLADDLTTTEAAVIEICGIDLLHERASETALAQVRARIGVRSNTTVRRIIHDLGIKVRALAVEHFDVEALVSRSGYERLAS